MFSNFWEWFIIILFIIIIFEAHNIHLWKASIQQKLENIKNSIQQKKNQEKQDINKDKE